ncbi:asparagine synthase-related protein [Chitinivorax sp. PXF-14]|uniref:asparagine synthetase B family protein n=1 Tax=Chitinivorax sp. PXF-14 TaxID=3230488 RepID=UPI003465AE80
MSGLCGWVGHHADPQTARDTLDRMLSELTRFDGARPALALDAGAAVGGALLKHAPVIHHDGGVMAIVVGHPRMTSPTWHSLEMRHGIAAALAEGYAKLGTEILKHVAGGFALALVDTIRQRALLATDRFASHNLCYAELDDGLVFASHARALRQHPGVTGELDPQAIYHYLYFHMIPGPDMVYRDMRRLQNGEYLEWRDGKVHIARYWEPVFVESQARGFVEQKESFISLMRESVREASLEAETGCFLSGGTDSSTIAGMLTDVSGKPARTYSIGFEAEGYDEMAFARLASSHFKTRHTEYYVTPDDVVDAIPKIAAISDQPFGNASAVPGYYCARMARQDGVERMLGGDGGDELFGGNARYAKQQVFAIYERVPGGLRNGLIEPLAFNLPQAIPVIRKARSYIEQAKTPMPARLESYNLLERFGADKVLTRDFLSRIDPAQPLTMLKHTWNQAHARDMVNQMLALDFKYTLADNDLVKVNLACELAGVDIAYPMLHDKLTAFSLSLEPGWKLKGQQLRWFFKEALRGFLPDDIITKEKHGFGLPFGPWLQKHAGLQQLVQDSLTDLKPHGIVAPDFIDEVMSKLREHPGYYGTMVWILMMLSQWLREQRTSR